MIRHFFRRLPRPRGCVVSCRWQAAGCYCPRKCTRNRRDTTNSAKPVENLIRPFFRHPPRPLACVVLGRWQGSGCYCPRKRTRKEADAMNSAKLVVNSIQQFFRRPWCSLGCVVLQCAPQYVVGKLRAAIVLANAHEKKQMPGIEPDMSKTRYNNFFDVRRAR